MTQLEFEHSNWQAVLANLRLLPALAGRSFEEKIISFALPQLDDGSEIRFCFL